MSVGVTGMAWTTALGDDLDAVWVRLLAGETGLAPLPAPSPLRSELAASIPSIPLALPPSERLVRMACDAASRAMSAADCDPRDPGVRLILGTSLGGLIEDDPPAATAHAWADACARLLGFAGRPIVVSTACSAGSDAIMLGGELIRAGVARCCVCGGADVLTLSKRLAHSTLGTMSASMLRAFDVRHDGTLLGEGAGFLILEADGSAARPVARLRGAGSSSDATSMTAPDATGAAACLALERSLADAGATPADVAVINAHASGTPLNDATEQAAFNRLFPGPDRPIVFGTKGNFGHSLGATGALEAIALVRSLATGRVPPVVGLEQPVPGFHPPLPRGAPAQAPAGLGLSLTLGFGGFNTSLVFERCS